MFRKKIYKKVKSKNLNIITWFIKHSGHVPYIIYVRVCEGQFKRQNTCTGAYIYMYASYKLFAIFWVMFNVYDKKNYIILVL